MLEETSNPSTKHPLSYLLLALFGVSVYWRNSLHWLTWQLLLDRISLLVLTQHNIRPELNSVLLFLEQHSPQLLYVFHSSWEC